MSYQSKYTGQEIDSKLDEINNKANQTDLVELQNNKLNTSDLLNKVYPVGSIYLAYNHTSPASLFGGTWTRISQQFLWASSADGTIGATGGTQTHTHTSAAHTHTVAGHTHTSAAHTHSTTAVALTEAQMPKHNHAVQYQVSGYEGWTNQTSVAGQYVFDWNNNLFSNNNSAQVTTYIKNQTLIQSNKGSGSTHSHGNTGSTTPGATGSTSLTTNSTTPDNTGSSSNMPPYIQVSMWRRTE